jgi:hypothetical protein
VKHWQITAGWPALLGPVRNCSTDINAPYYPTVGAFANVLRAYLGQEPTTPAQVANAITQLANCLDAPVRLLLGVDAAQYANQAA